MTKEEFEAVEAMHAESGQPLKEFLSEIGVPYSTYHYWKKKTTLAERTMPLAPICIVEEPGSAEDTVAGEDGPAAYAAAMSGVTLAFPNGVRAHFGQGSERVLMEVLSLSLQSHVLPQ